MTPEQQKINEDIAALARKHAEEALAAAQK